MSWLEEVAGRVRPGAPVVLEVPWLLAAAAVALAVVLVPGVWRWVRLGVTLVHELGHAVVGMAVGRQFTGFVLRGDASGHAVTRGPGRGAGLVATTWAGYPAPAVLGATAAWTASRGWAAPVLSVLLLVLLIGLVRVRSLLAGVVTLASMGLLGWAWWGWDEARQALLLLVLATVLVAGAWRHLGAVAGSRSPASDPAVLASLTRVPRAVWLFTFAMVCAGSTLVLWSVVRSLAP